MRILSTGSSKGVKFNFFFNDVSKPLLLVLVSLSLSLRSFYLPLDLVFSSFFRLPLNPFTINASSPFMYFCALNNRFVIEVGGVFPREKTRSRLFNHPGRSSLSPDHLLHRFLEQLCWNASHILSRFLFPTVLRLVDRRWASYGIDPQWSDEQRSHSVGQNLQWTPWAVYLTTPLLLP